MMMYQLCFLLFVALTAATPDCKSPPPMPFMEMATCCEAPEMSDEFAKAMESKCGPYNHVIGPPTPEKMCHMECIYKATGILENDSINVEKGKDALAKMIKDDEFQTAFEKAFETCAPRVEEKLKSLKDKPKTDCSLLPMMMTFCTKGEVFLNCPASKWNKKDNKNCDPGREYMKACPDAWKTHGPRGPPGPPPGALPKEDKN